MTGSSRTFLDIQGNNLPLVQGQVGNLVSLNGRIMYSGMGHDFFTSVLVNVILGGNIVVSGPVHTPVPNLVANWEDIVYDHIRGVVYCAINWWGNGRQYTNFLSKYQNLNEGTSGEPWVNSTINFCGDGCGRFPFSRVSTLDFRSQIYTSLVQHIHTGHTWIFQVDVTSGELTSVVDSNRLFGISNLVLNHNDNKYYSWLNAIDGFTMFNSTIVTIDPTTAETTFVSLIDVPMNVPIEMGDTKMPLFADFDFRRGVAYGLYQTRLATDHLEFNLYTIDILTGAVVHKVPFTGNQRFEPWGLCAAP